MRMGHSGSSLGIKHQMLSLSLVRSNGDSLGVHAVVRVLVRALWHLEVPAVVLAECQR